MITKGEAANLLAGLDLGSAVAESDTLLETVRVETSVFDDLLADRVDLIPGTKGSGKTALFRIFVDFLPKMMLQDKKVIIAHGVQQRQDTVFLAYKRQFDQLTESDFVDFWCIYIMSLSYEQFVRDDSFRILLTDCASEVSNFRRAYREAGIPDFERSKTLPEILAWTLRVLSHLKPKVTWKPPEDIGQFEFSFGDVGRAHQSTSGDNDPRMPSYIDAIALGLEQILTRLTCISGS